MKTLIVLLISLIVSVASAQQITGYTVKNQNTNSGSKFVNKILNKQGLATNSVAKAIDPELVALKKQLEREKINTLIAAEHAKQARHEAAEQKAQTVRTVTASTPDTSRFDNYYSDAGPTSRTTYRFSGSGRDMSSWPTAGAYGGSFRGSYYPYGGYRLYPTYSSMTTWHGSAGFSFQTRGGCRVNHRHNNWCW